MREMVRAANEMVVEIFKEEERLRKLAETVALSDDELQRRRDPRSRRRRVVKNFLMLWLPAAASPLPLPAALSAGGPRCGSSETTASDA